MISSGFFTQTLSGNAILCGFAVGLFCAGLVLECAVNAYSDGSLILHVRLYMAYVVLCYAFSLSICMILKTCLVRPTWSRHRELMK